MFAAQIVPPVTSLTIVGFPYRLQPCQASLEVTRIPVRSFMSWESLNESWNMGGSVVKPLPCSWHLWGHWKGRAS